MVLKSKKIIGFSILGVLLTGGLIYLYIRNKNKNQKTVGSIIKDAFDNLEFEFGKSKIKDSSLPFLDELSSVLIAEPSWKLELAGHTDNKGSDELNMVLSKNRAEAVKSYLVGKNISADRIIVNYFGEKNPIASNDTEDGRAKNRRVEMKLLKSDGNVLTVEDKQDVVDIEKKQIAPKNSKKVNKSNSVKEVKEEKKVVKTENKKEEKVNPNRSKGIKIDGVLIYVSDDNKGRLVFEDGSRIGKYRVNAKAKILGVTAWSGIVSVKKIFKYPNGSVKIIDSTGKDFDGESTDLLPLVKQFKEGKSNLVANIGQANLNLQKMA
jgi:hypothetical protein